jgi:hypothetical protein
MTEKPKQVWLEAEGDLLALVKASAADSDSPVLERGGEDVAVLLFPEDRAALTGKPRPRSLPSKPVLGGRVPD